jgi:hypothetical protein
LVVGLVLLSAKSVQFVIQLRRSEQSRISRSATVISVLFTSTSQYVGHTQKATRMDAACVHVQQRKYDSTQRVQLLNVQASFHSSLTQSVGSAQMRGASLTSSSALTSHSQRLAISIPQLTSLA